jgi:hypothetical protein
MFVAKMTTRAACPLTLPGVGAEIRLWSLQALSRREFRHRRVSGALGAAPRSPPPVTARPEPTFLWLSRPEEAATPEVRETTDMVRTAIRGESDVVPNTA